MNLKSHLLQRIKTLHNQKGTPTGLMLMAFATAGMISFFVIERAQWRNGESCSYAPNQSFCR